MALILSPEVDQHRIEIPPLATSETFTQWRRWRIGAGSPNAKDSVNGASDAVFSDANYSHHNWTLDISKINDRM